MIFSEIGSRWIGIQRFGRRNGMQGRRWKSHMMLAVVFLLPPASPVFARKLLLTANGPVERCDFVEMDIGDGAV
jgi:hypothetical protein